MQRLYAGIALTLAVSFTGVGNVMALSPNRLNTATPKSEILIAQNPVIASGGFVKVEKSVAGNISIVEENGKRYLELSEDFQTASGPDLKVILHTGDTVEQKVAEGDYINLGLLQDFNGSGRYAIPDDVDLSKYGSVAIWCEQFNATFGYATLNTAMALLSIGDFVPVEHLTQGQASIVEENGIRYLELSENFQTDNGPDLKVILHTADTLDLKVQEGDYINLGALEAFNGSGRYAIPDDLDLNKYSSVAIWCEQFNATFGYAPLAAAE